MYAKLVFPTGTTSGEAVRDIAKLINASSSGTASLNDLEFITTASSELVAGTNSGWSLHSSTSTLGSGAISSTDAKYILQGTTATGSKSKYVGIQCNGSWSSSSAYNSTSCGICLSNVLDPGDALEYWSYGYSSTSTTYFNRNSFNPASTIHVFAEPRKLMLFGETHSGTSYCQGQFEAAETPNTTYRQLPPTVLFTWGKTTISNTSGSTGKQGSFRGGSFFGDNTLSDQSLVQWSGSMYSDNPNAPGVVRGLGVYCGSFRGASASYSDTTYQSASLLIANGTTALGSSYTTTGLGSSFNAIFFPTIRYEMFGPGAKTGTFSATSYNGGAWGNADMSTRDASGNKAIPLRPIIADWPVLCADIYNISDVSKIWWAPIGLGAAGDTVTIGSDVYMYLPQTTAAGGAILVKRI